MCLVEVGGVDVWEVETKRWQQLEAVAGGGRGESQGGECT